MSVLAALPLGFIGLGYLFTLLDRRDDRPSKDDKQVGSKLVLWVLILTGVTLALSGVHGLLAFILGGFKNAGPSIKAAIVPIVVGGASAAAFGLGLLPRTNNSTHQQVERFALGVLGALGGLGAIAGFYGLVDGLVNSRGWPSTSNSLALLVVAGGVGAVAMMRHGQLSGWTQAPARPAAPMPPAGGYPQQGGGYPPQGGGYPQQGGGYPQQGGGYPQQGGGYPQQGGGYPPQGGGGYPPQGGGGGGGYGR
ncbi:MAG: hypothetical protein R3B06_18745 [Kofleriaceae bacterium]